VRIAQGDIDSARREGQVCSHPFSAMRLWCALWHMGGGTLCWHCAGLAPRHEPCATWYGQHHAFVYYRSLPVHTQLTLLCSMVTC
jgi:hypothetical protein